MIPRTICTLSQFHSFDHLRIERCRSPCRNGADGGIDGVATGVSLTLAVVAVVEWRWKSRAVAVAHPRMVKEIGSTLSLLGLYYRGTCHDIINCYPSQKMEARTVLVLRNLHHTRSHQRRSHPVDGPTSTANTVGAVVAAPDAVASASSRRVPTLMSVKDVVSTSGSVLLIHFCQLGARHHVHQCRVGSKVVVVSAVIAGGDQREVYAGCRPAGWSHGRLFGGACVLVSIARRVQSVRVPGVAVVVMSVVSSAVAVPVSCGSNTSRPTSVGNMSAKPP